MKTNIVKITAVSLFAAAIMAAPATLRAAESTNAPASEESGSKHKKNSSDIVPFHGKVTAVDKAAMTITVGQRTFNITSTTKITKDGLPATLADATVGEEVGGAYKRASSKEKLDATSLRIGAKVQGEAIPKKKKKQASAGENANAGAATQTNSVPK